MGIKRRKRAGYGVRPAIAFGVGMLVAVCFPVRFTLLVAAALIVYIGVTCT